MLDDADRIDVERLCDIAHAVIEAGRGVRSAGDDPEPEVGEALGAITARLVAAGVDEAVAQRAVTRWFVTRAKGGARVSILGCVAVEMDPPYPDGQGASGDERTGAGYRRAPRLAPFGVTLLAMSDTHPPLDVPGGLAKAITAAARLTPAQKARRYRDLIAESRRALAAAADAAVVEALETGAYTHAALAQELRVTPYAVNKAVTRHRQAARQVIPSGVDASST